MSDQIRFIVKDFRAIKEADIKLNGITVVSGVNGCGKSTLSKFLYNTVKAVNNYDGLVIQQLENSLDDVFRFINILEKEVKSTSLFDFNSFFTNPSGLNNKEFIEEKQEVLIDYIVSLFSKYKLSTLNNADTNRSNRLINTLKNTLFEYSDNNHFETLISKLYQQINDYFNGALVLMDRRPNYIIQKELIDNFSGNQIPRVYSLLEYDVPIFNNELEAVSFIHSLDQIAYIDTPMQLGIAGVYDSWDDLDKILNYPKNTNSNYYVNSIIKREIIKGDSVLEEEDKFTGDNIFKFRRDDGYEFDLLDVATGVKSFAILQLLLKNGFLTKNTLLIIDEPEAHLHPQWIVEYARVITLLNKEIGVKFLIASHSPDMISAIRYICEKEQTTDKLEYYLAEEVGKNSYLYQFTSLGKDIEPIFNSFNIALDRINQYGISNDNELF
ncbi:MAG: AAA family ATPase [Paludibacter sp.]|nr:AAA family ATPase [Paludibacter sp.]